MRIRPMRFSDLDFALHCTMSEGWEGETKEMFDGFLQFNPKGCFVAELEAERIGICVATRYQNHGFIGALIIIKEMRGQGYGKRLFGHSVRYLQSKGIRNIYLDGDLEAIPIYERAGFKKICRSLRFTGSIRGKKHAMVRKAIESDIQKICDIDCRLFGDNREFFLKRLCSLFPDYSFVAESDHQLSGYLLARPGIGVVSVGPWAAMRSVADPGVLLESFADEVGDRRLRIGVLECNRNAVAKLRAYDSLKEQIPSWRMVSGPSRRLGIHDHLYACGSGAKG